MGISTFIRSKTMRSVLQLFFSQPQGKFFAREVQRLTREPMGALQRQLILLVQKGVLKSERKGPLKFYFLNSEYPGLEQWRSLFLREYRRELLEKALERTIQILKAKYQPDKIVLFGSMATGNISEHSDLDLLIIKNNVPKRYWDRIKELAPILGPLHVGIDFSIWTGLEWKEGLTSNLFLQEEIIKKGKVIYDKAA